MVNTEELMREVGGRVKLRMVMEFGIRQMVMLPLGIGSMVNVDLTLLEKLQAAINSLER